MPPLIGGAVLEALEAPQPVVDCLHRPSSSLRRSTAWSIASVRSNCPQQLRTSSECCRHFAAPFTAEYHQLTTGKSRSVQDNVHSKLAAFLVPVCHSELVCHSDGKSAAVLAELTFYYILATMTFTCCKHRKTTTQSLTPTAAKPK